MHFSRHTVVILLSDKRSGSTMVQEELCRHPAIQHVAYSPHTYYETHHWLKGAVVMGMPHPIFADGKTYPGYGSRKGARRYLIDGICGNVPEFPISKADGELVFGGWDALCARFAQPVFFEKSPQYLAQWAALSLLLQWMQSTDYQVRLIGLVRNPLAVMHSAQKLFFTEPETRQFAWAQSYRNLLSFSAMLQPGQIRIIRYEDIIENPPEKFREICRFIGVDYDAAIGAGVHGEAGGRWHADPEFPLQLHESVKQVAHCFGYRDEEMYNPSKPGPSPWRKHWKRVEAFLKLARARVRDRVWKPALLRFRNGRNHG